MPAKSAILAVPFRSSNCDNSVQGSNARQDDVTLATVRPACYGQKSLALRQQYVGALDVAMKHLLSLTVGIHQAMRSTLKF